MQCPAWGNPRSVFSPVVIQVSHQDPNPQNRTKHPQKARITLGPYAHPLALQSRLFVWSPSSLLSRHAPRGKASVSHLPRLVQKSCLQR